MKAKRSRILAWLLVLTMVFTMLPAVAFAEEPATGTSETVDPSEPTEPVEPGGRRDGGADYRGGKRLQGLYL